MNNNKDIRTSGKSIPVKATISIICIIFFYILMLSYRVGCSSYDSVIHIPKGSSLTKTAEILQTSGCLSEFESKFFIFVAKICFKQNDIHHGKYTLSGIATIGELLSIVTTPSKNMVKITVIEGWDVERIADEVRLKLNIDRDKFIKISKDVLVAKRLGINAPNLEGYLYPDTYFVSDTYDEWDLITLFVRNFKNNYKTYIKSLNPGMTINDVVTMASIIQGEAMNPDEMQTISSVYHNRLKRNMLLQADPTIQYVIPGKNRRLWNKDLKVDSPYNTYKYKGLPPGPINNPGIKALKAAVTPLETEYLYFVSDGSGNHIFNTNVKDHNKSKIHLKKKRREMRSRKK
tara:strand:+ start:400 stop:1437 length:1038 start_codon:yes stop_codon:yes gene_type:complete